MKAVVMTAAGAPDVLALRDVPQPRAGAGQVLVRTEAIGTHAAETLMRAGAFPMPTPPPTVFGTQAVGVVAEAGAGVDRELLGARVATATGSGAYAEYVVAEAAAITPVPDELSSVDAVAVAMPGSVAVALLAAADLSGGAAVLVTAGATGVGGYLTQLVRQTGPGLLAVTAGAAKRDRAHALGADLVIDSATPDWPTALGQRLAGGTLDAVFDSIGGDAAAALLDLMTPGAGRLLGYGLLSGAPAAITAGDLMFRGLTLVGCGGPGFHARLPAARRTAFELAAAGQLTPLVDSALALGDAPEAHRRIEAREHTGMVVLMP